MLKQNKGSALLQVLVLGALIATIVVVLLKFSVTRTANMVQTKTIVGSKMAMQSCINILAEEDIKRIQQGRPPWFEEHSSYPCSVNGYTVNITRQDYRQDTLADHKTGVVRGLDFKVKLLE